MGNMSDKKEIWKEGAKAALDECMAHIISGCEGCFLWPPGTPHAECPFEFAQDWLAQQAGESGYYPGWIRSDDDLKRSYAEWKKREEEATP